jgi:hypothetical protein
LTGVTHASLYGSAAAHALAGDAAPTTPSTGADNSAATARRARFRTMTLLFVYGWYMNTPVVGTDGYSPGIPHWAGG